MDAIALTVLAQQVLLGLLLGGLYGLAAAGLSLVFGVLKVLDVAHGELIMLGGYGTFWLFALLRIDPFASLLLVIPGALVLGAAWSASVWPWRCTRWRCSSGPRTTARSPPPTAARCSTWGRSPSR